MVVFLIFIVALLIMALICLFDEEIVRYYEKAKRKFKTFWQWLKYIFFKTI